MKTTILTLATVASMISGSLIAQTLQFNINTFDPICHNDATGKVKVFIIGGQPPYFVNGEQIQNNIFTKSSLEAGNYSLQISDAINNSNTVNFTIINPNPISIDALVTHVTVYDGNNGRIELTTNPSYSYFWTAKSGYISNPTSEDQFNLKAGNYTVKATNTTTGCMATKKFTVKQPSFPSINSGYTPNTIASNQSTNTSSAMHIFPNPSTGTINLTAEKDLTESYIMNDFGIIVHRCEANLSGSTETIQLNPGTYTLIGVDKSGTQFAERIMIR